MGLMGAVGTYSKQFHDRQSTPEKPMSVPSEMYQWRCTNDCAIGPINRAQSTGRNQRGAPPQNARKVSSACCHDVSARSDHQCSDMRAGKSLTDTRFSKTSHMALMMGLWGALPSCACLINVRNVSRPSTKRVGSLGKS